MERVGREAWAKRIERWKDSGLTAAEFASETGINAHSLSWWKWRLGTEGQPDAPRRRPRRKAQPRPLTFVELAAPVRSEALEVVLASGRCIRVPVGFDTATLERLLGVLEPSA
jgi:hypothetical protein